jgi:hypothetical protein
MYIAEGWYNTSLKQLRTMSLHRLQKLATLVVKLVFLHVSQSVADNWRKISRVRIQNCSVHRDFRISEQEIPDVIDGESTIIDELQNVKNCEEFLNIESNIRCYDQNEDCAVVIVERIIATKRQGGDWESDGDDTFDQNLVTHQKARKCTFRPR